MTAWNVIMCKIVFFKDESIIRVIIRIVFINSKFVIIVIITRTKAVLLPVDPPWQLRFSVISEFGFQMFFVNLFPQLFLLYIYICIYTSYSQFYIYVCIYTSYSQFFLNIFIAFMVRYSVPATAVVKHMRAMSITPVIFLL